MTSVSCSSYLLDFSVRVTRNPVSGSRVSAIAASSKGVGVIAGAVSSPFLGNKDVSLSTFGDPRLQKHMITNVRATQELSGSNKEVPGGRVGAKLVAGSPVVMTEAPMYIKTAEPMPMLRPNDGILNVGDAGRIIERRPKGLWAVRFAIGAYLVDEKDFRAMDA